MRVCTCVYVFYGLIYFCGRNHLISDQICTLVLQLCDLPYTLDQGSVGNKWLPESQCANV